MYTFSYARARLRSIAGTAKINNDVRIEPRLCCVYVYDVAPRKHVENIAMLYNTPLWIVENPWKTRVRRKY
jgi:hypothetical protein